jgi:hypothetical protein
MIAPKAKAKNRLSNDLMKTVEPKMSSQEKNLVPKSENNAIISTNIFNNVSVPYNNPVTKIN